MKQMELAWVVLTALAVAVIVVLPVSAVVAPSETTAAVTGNKLYVTATVSAASIIAGTPMTISGTAKGVSEVQIWAFAGNYVNVSTVPVNADGTYAKTYTTDGLPAATYYVFVQNPGADNKLQITVSGYSGQVVNSNTGAVIFNFTGTGSVQDAAAVSALSNALNSQGGDDIYTKTQFVITAPGAAPVATTAMMPGSDRDTHGCIGSAGYTWCEAKQKCLRPWEESCPGGSAVTTLPPAAPTATKSPLQPLAVITGLFLACCAVAYCRKK